MEKLNIRGQLRGPAGSVGKRHSCDWILSSADRSKPPGEHSATTAQLENGLSWKKVHQMTEGLRAPQHPIFGDWISILEIPLAVALKTREKLIWTIVGHIFSKACTRSQSRIPILNCLSYDRSQRLGYFPFGIVALQASQIRDVTDMVTLTIFIHRLKIHLLARHLLHESKGFEYRT